jgi:hypothetical protein
MHRNLFVTLPMVFASSPVASLRRLAARPVGAHSGTRMRLARRAWRILVTMVVLPTPGPPVMTAMDNPPP